LGNTVDSLLRWTRVKYKIVLRLEVSTNVTNYLTWG